MNKLINESTVSILSYPTDSAGGSVSTAFLDMKDYRNALFQTSLHILPDQKGEGVATMTVYEHTATVWTGVATAVTASVVTGALNSVSSLLLQKELLVEQLSVNNSKRYVSIALTLPTTTAICSTVTRWCPRFEPQN